MSASSSVLSVTGATYPAQNAPQILLEYTPEYVEAFITSASVVAFSFDGTNDHGRLDSTNFKSVLRRSTYKKVWFRVVSGADPATVVWSQWGSQ